MGDVVLSPAIFSAVSNLSAVQAQMEAAPTRLATGKRVNTPLDDPNAYFTAAALSSCDDQISALDSSADSALLLALQTRQQLAATSLSLVHGSYAAALQLFG